MAWFRVGLSRRSVVSLRGFSASVGCSIRYALAPFFASISGFARLFFSRCSVIDCNGFVWLGFFYFSLSVLRIGFDWVRVACVFNFVCVGEWVFG